MMTTSPGKLILLPRKPTKETQRTCSEYKSDGKRKARPADPIRSYNDFAAMQSYFLKRGKIRDWALWTIGVSVGFRISDLLSLKISAFLNPDRTFRQRTRVIEQKTSKVNNCLITESVVYALTKYFDSIDWQFSLNDYVFPSAKTKGKMYEEYGWRIISDAGKALKLPFNVGSHTMRKSFASIAVCVDKSTIDMNAIVKIQGLLNHSDQKTTMRYLGALQEMYDRARAAVSDFILGKTEINELVVGSSLTIEDVIQKLDLLEIKISG
ncbi:MAG: tyrosine-type recombinase/integrase [Firmicutes bacterium]|nr:tyrosine-type recombinase/integrase [Bacillota bacterium]